ncbi:hypothetical protein SI65_08442 [Aspergillus cristatus]|uniref:Uncharacterized protein n=1 Tax=Aspergillus cristatus TaxID=573508 RepID=A0A1E3B537_ASPCR|nr:hypothetical protein SI65_08442 [Aspergillus cristatus]
MVADLVKLYGPGMSYYLPNTEGSTTNAEDDKKSPAEKYSAALRALYSSNQILEKKMSKLRASTIRLNLDLMKLQRHMSTMQHDFLTTWQADILTLLIEVVFARCHRVLPGGYAVEEIESLDYETLTRVYRTAAKRIQKERLRRNFGLSAKYYFALQKYWEVVEFRSEDPFQTECVFARWLVAEKEKDPGVYEFWGKLFPLCYRRTVEESAAIF